MAISYPDILEIQTNDVNFTWSDQDPILYALGIGLGEDPLDRRELPFVVENGLKVVPTFAAAFAKAASPQPPGINRALLLDGERELILHKTLPANGAVVMDGRIVGVSDRGRDKGAIVRREVTIREALTGDIVAEVRGSVFARGDGGFGGPQEGRSSERPAKPSRSPDREERVTTRPNQALLYRLSGGDRNPLHSDPEFAARAGFDRPILHGLCTYGICCRALLQSFADYDPAAIKVFAARFSAPCYPGETILIDLWNCGSEVHFEARIEERPVTVIKNGFARLG